MKLVVDYNDSYLPHEVFHARMACFDFHNGVKTAMYKAVHLDADVSPRTLLKEAYAAQEEFQGKISKSSSRDLEALIWHCERAINLPKVDALIKEAVDLALKCGLSYGDTTEILLGERHRFNLDD